MLNFLRTRSFSLTMVVLVLLAIVVLQESISYSVTFGRLASFAFSPTDTLPLTRRAKMLMLLQATISIITLTGIAGSAINILASSG